MRRLISLAIGSALVVTGACAQGPQNSNGGPSPVAPTTVTAPAATGGVPALPPFNLEAILQPVSSTYPDAFGLVKFRQPNDVAKVVYLDAWVRDLAPNSAYQLQRAVDTTLDGVCTGTAWLTLGADNTTARSILTDDRGTGEAALSRTLPTGTATGTAFDIDFRVIVADSSPANVVLQSDCYRYVVR